MRDVYQATLGKDMFLKSRGFNVVEIWECEIHRQLENSPEVKALFEPLEPTEAFIGFRKNAAKLFHECTFLGIGLIVEV